MTTRYVRLVGRCADYEDYPMYLDAPVETTEEGTSMITKAIMCGFMGKMGGEFHPMVLRKDKSEHSPHFPFVMDFGSGCAEYERYYWTNLPIKRIAKGAQFTIGFPGEEPHSFEEAIYKIVEIIDPVRQQAIDTL